MEATEVRYMDKETWGPGPWQEEADRIEWRHVELPCLVLRSHTGALCGYVACPPGHPFFGAGREDIHVNVHGGVTFAKHGDGVFWIGFDCGHHFDDQPATRAHLREIFAVLPPPPDALFGEIALARLFGNYRPVPYVMAEVESLAEQVRRAAVRLLP